MITLDYLIDLSTTDLIELARAVNEKADETRKDWYRVKGELERRMEEAGATMLEGDGATAELQTTPKYAWDDDILLSEVKPHLRPSDWEYAVVEGEPRPVLKAQTVRLKSLAKKLGPNHPASKGIENAMRVTAATKIVLTETK